MQPLKRPLWAVLIVLSLPLTSFAWEMEELARDFLKKAVRAEKSKKKEEARAWYRATAVCYRFLILPVRLAQLDS